MPAKSTKRADLPGADLLFGSPSGNSPASEGATPPVEGDARERADTLTRKQADTVAGERASTYESKQPDTPASGNTGTPAGKPADAEEAERESRGKDEKGEKLEKFTFYFEPDTLEGLEEVWIRWRSARKRIGRRAISKSDIVNAALKAALEDPEALLERLGR